MTSWPEDAIPGTKMAIVTPGRTFYMYAESVEHGVAWQTALMSLNTFLSELNVEKGGSLSVMSSLRNPSRSRDKVRGDWSTWGGGWST